MHFMHHKFLKLLEVIALGMIKQRRKFKQIKYSRGINQHVFILIMSKFISLFKFKFKHVLYIIQTI